MTVHHFPFLALCAARTGIVLLWLFVGMRVMGKRQIGQMNVYDLALIMMLASATFALTFDPATLRRARRRLRRDPPPEV